LSQSEAEIRTHPLTGETARICHFTIDRAPPVDFGEAIVSTRAECPFCPERVLQVTPRFEAGFTPLGRIRRGQAVVFPNLFPYDDYSAITVVSAAHSLSMADMPVGEIVDALGASLDFLRIVDRRVSEANQLSYPLVTWNFMPPAGGSQIHPHLQVIHTAQPANGQRRLLTAGAAWAQDTGRPFDADLSAAEKARGERWIGENGATQWLVPFLPTGMLGDCMALFPGRAAITDLSEADLVDFATGLRWVCAGFAEMGLQSFNLVITGDASGAAAERCWVTAAVVPRFYVNPVMRSCDVAYMQLCLHENFAMVYPEETAERLRRHWNPPD
jgi:galactose-1-phosphate uridylyltransferase